MQDKREAKHENLIDDGRRFCVALLIIHPTIDPDEITNVLGLEPKVQHRVGDRRATPKGAPLPGSYGRTDWRHSRIYRARGQHFSNQVETFAKQLLPHKSFLRRVTSTGGTAEIIVSFLGDGYHGDTIPVAALRDFAEIGLSLGLEVHKVQQRSCVTEEEILLGE